MDVLPSALFGLPSFARWAPAVRGIGSIVGLGCRERQSGGSAMSRATFANDAADVPKFNDIHARFSPTRNVNVELARSLSPSERLAVWVTDRVGSMGFFFAVAIWTVLWLGWNTVGPAELRFDPGPSFLTWLFVSNLLQLHLMPLIMVGQNLQARYGELVASADFNISQRTEAEVEAILQHLTNQNALMLEILRRVESLELQRASR